MKVNFYRHNLGNEELESLKRVFNSVYLSNGPKTAEFEKKIAPYLKLPWVIGTASGTAALHLALLALGIKKGDEIITTPLSFVATTNAILYVGAKPIFVDVEAETGNINADLIEKAITKKTKAILPVHLYGQMCDMKKISQIAKKYKLHVIEDSAHCLEGSRDGVRPGQLSDLATLSFYATKNITAGEGGAVITNNKKLSQRLKILRYHGMTSGAEKRFTLKYKPWDIIELGWKYNMFDVQAALLIPQIPKIEQRLKIKEKIAQYYDQAFGQVKEIDLLKKLPQTKHARHLYPILVKTKKRDLIVQKLKMAGVGVTVNYKPIHLLKYYRKIFSFKRGDFKNAELIGLRTISLPFYPKLSRKEIDYVINTVIKVVKIYS